MQRSRRARLGIERLENRSLMAGNVTAFTSGANLHIEGDDAANTIAVESFGDGVVQVRGFNDNTLNPTSVNQTPNGLRLFFDVRGDIIIHMRGGSDLVRVSNLVVGNNLVIDLGAGANELITGREPGFGARFGGTLAGPLYVQGELEIFGGDSVDTVFQSDIHVARPSSTDLGGGDDMLTMQRPLGSGANVEYFGGLTILPKSGADTINATGVIAGGLLIDDEFGPTTVRMNSMNIFGTLKVLTDNQSDFVSITSTNTAGQVVFALEGGVDVATYVGLADDVGVHMGDGNDSFTLSALIDELIVELGRDNDTLNLSGLAARKITVHGDDGNDTFNVSGVQAAEAQFYGDKNVDVYREPIVPPNRIRKLLRFTIERFETF